MNVYEIITKKLIEKMEAGVIPWKQPWTNKGVAVNWKTQKPYRGINKFILPRGGEFASKKQILAAGGRIKYEEMRKSHIVVYWLWTAEKDKETGEETGKKFAKPFFYQVWEINTQCTGLTSKRGEITTFEHDPIEEAEKIIQGYPGAPTIGFASGKAVYTPALDSISVPPLQDYEIVDEYYSTLFHEMAHSTEHTKRLNRKGITEDIKFGSEKYAKEELIAEFGAAMLCGVAGIDNSTLDNSAAYLDAWLGRLKKDPKLAVTAAAQAQKAADYILGVVNEQTEGEEEAA